MDKATLINFPNIEMNRIIKKLIRFSAQISDNIIIRNLERNSEGNNTNYSILLEITKIITKHQRDMNQFVLSQLEGEIKNGKVAD